MAILTTPQRISVAVALALAGSISPAASALKHTGGATIGELPSVRVYDASDPDRPILTKQSDLNRPSGPFALAHDALFVASGREVRRVDRNDLSPSQPEFSTWSAAAPILSLTDGTERGLVLALDTRGLTLVRFSDGSAPVAVWSYAIEAGTADQNYGRLVVRDGNRAFVADASLPGVRVVSIEPDQAPKTIATYASPDGAIHDLALWGRRLTLATDSGLTVVNVSEGDEPKLTRRGAFDMERTPTRVDVNSRYAFVADGRSLSVVDIDPNSPGFLSCRVDGWDASTDIVSVRLDKANRAYVLVHGAYEILDLGLYGGK
jgi:hypothetical protein